MSGLISFSYIFRDSAFPFKVGDELVARIEDARMEIEGKGGNLSVGPRSLLLI
jgi:hypothetical protein